MILPHPLLVLSTLAAQAGGGGSFGGGAGGGGGGGGGFGGFGGDGGGEGAGQLLYLLIRFAIEYPALGIPLIILLGTLGAVGTSRGWWKHQERVIGRARPARRAQASASSAAVLRRSDPLFDEERFLGRVGIAFDKAQASWCAQDLEPLRPFVSDGVFERFSLQIEEQRLDGWRQGMDRLQVLSSSIVHVQSGLQFDTVTVRISFRSDIHRLSLETGARIPGSELKRDFFGECWSFLRRTGTKTLQGEGLIEGKCPNCGADLALNQSARCSYCECLARSGRFDWVLAEITQASEWRAEDERGIPGLVRYTERDPGLSAQQLEDRASVAFWRQCAAERLGGPGPLMRLASAEFCAHYEQSFAPAAAGRRTYTADCAVGSVRTLGILAGEERDRAVLEIVWDGVRARVDGDGERSLESTRHLRRSLYVFARQSGQETALDEAFTTTHCSTCGAHDTGGTGATCPYCEAPRTGGPAVWLLDDVLSHASAAAGELRREIEAARSVRATAAPAAPEQEPSTSASDPSVAGLMAWAVALVRAEQGIDAKERRAIHALAEREGMAPERVAAILEGEQDLAPEPRDQREAEAWLASLHELALADGSTSPGERKFLRHAAERLGLDARAHLRALRTARAKLFRDSREARSRA